LHCKIYPNWDFWFENIPSGNHGWMVGRQMWQLLASLFKKTLVGGWLLVVGPGKKNLLF
jgi:dihydrofolate reductase